MEEYRRQDRLAVVKLTWYEANIGVVTSSVALTVATTVALTVATTVALTVGSIDCSSGYIINWLHKHMHQTT